MSSPTESLAAWLRLTLVPGVGGETQRRLLKLFGLPEAIFAAGSQALSEAIGATLAERLLTTDTARTVDAALAWVAEDGNRILTLADADYPQALLSTDDPPVLLYTKGHIEFLNRPAIAIVGSRNATRQGIANAEAFAKTFAEAGLTVVSGLALGIDAAAHRGALEGRGSTVAVVGTGLDRIYPARNADLARQVADRGAIVGELPLATPPLPPNFPRRNRVIAGLVRGCLVVEAAEQSGSLITARLSAEAGREVFAIPGSIHSPLAKGCHRLIRQGARLVESARDVLDELAWEAAVSPVGKPRALAPLSDPEDVAIVAALGHDPCDLDALAARCGQPVDTLLARLLALELDGRVGTLPGGRYQRLD